MDLPPPPPAMDMPPPPPAMDMPPPPPATDMPPPPPPPAAGVDPTRAAIDAVKHKRELEEAAWSSAPAALHGDVEAGRIALKIGVGKLDASVTAVAYKLLSNDPADSKSKSLVFPRGGTVGADGLVKVSSAFLPHAHPRLVPRATRFPSCLRVVYVLVYALVYALVPRATRFGALRVPPPRCAVARRACDVYFETEY
jgi:hypothetical protein